MDYMDIAHSFGIIRRRTQAFVVDTCHNAGLNLTYSEFTLLFKLYEMEGCSQDELAAALYLDKAVVTRGITTLEQKGFVIRKKDTYDGRKRNVFITDLGRSKQIFMQKVVREMVNYLTAGFPEDKTEIAVELMAQMAWKLSRIDFGEVHAD